jgi:peroxiredoxin Q/BCP
VILGVSRDSLASHEKFRKKHEFPFDLLSDGDEKLCRLFDVIREKNMYGKKVMGVERSTFVIDGKGVLRHEWRKVKVDGHVEEVLAAVKAL